MATKMIEMEIKEPKKKKIASPKILPLKKSKTNLAPRILLNSTKWSNKTRKLAMKKK
jgi:hypothetical protein